MLKQRIKTSLSLGSWTTLVLIAAGCSSVPVYEQVLVSKPNMLFADSAVLTYNGARLLSQLEPGNAGAAGRQNSGCTACR